MIQDKKERCIAKITSIKAFKLEAELLSTVKSFNISGFDDIYQFIRLNGYVLITIEDKYIVASISSISEREHSSLPTDKDALNKIMSTKVLELFPLGVLEKDKFTFGVSNYPLLYSDVLYIKSKELNQLFLGHAPKDTADDASKYSLEIGTWTLMDAYKVRVRINDFFGFHSAILGNTGSGKSCTIAAILQSLYVDDCYPESKFIFFDVNGEYKQAFTNKNNNEQLKNIKLECRTVSTGSAEQEQKNQEFYLPLNLLNIDEWELLLKASAKAQAPILRNALGMYELCGGNNDTKKEQKDKIKTYIFCKLAKQILNSPDSSFTVSKIIANFQKFNNPLLTEHFKLGKKCIESPSQSVQYECIFFGNNPRLEFYTSYGQILHSSEFQEKISGLEEDNKPSEGDASFPYNNQCHIELKKLEEYMELAIDWEEAHGNKQVRDYCSAMITRLKSLVDRPEFKFFKAKEIEKPEESKSVQEPKEYVEEFLNANIFIIDFNSTDDEVIEIVSSVLSRLFFDYARKHISPRNSKPIHLVLDEAHRYVANGRQREYYFEANRIFERIAKESRKFGLFLILSSQRPSELNETVVSQCSNFIIHRIQNPNDLNYIKSMTPFISQSILNQLPSIPTQQALIFGTAVNLPILFKVKEADPLPDSENNNIAGNWGQKK